MQTSGLVLDRFRALKTERPRSKIALFRTLHPEIVATLRMGHTLRDIHERLVEDGVDISYALLRNYMSRIRREQGYSRLSRNVRHLTLPMRAEQKPAEPEDPLANAMRVLSKPRYDIRQAMCDGDPTRKKLV